MKIWFWNQCICFLWSVHYNTSLYCLVSLLIGRNFQAQWTFWLNCVCLSSLSMAYSAKWHIPVKNCTKLKLFDFKVCCCFRHHIIALMTHCILTGAGAISKEIAFCLNAITCKMYRYTFHLKYSLKNTYFLKSFFRSPGIWSNIKK